MQLIICDFFGGPGGVAAALGGHRLAGRGWQGRAVSVVA